MIVKSVSSRSRNLGYGWSTRTTDVNGTWQLVPPTEPTATGGLRSVNAEIDRRNLICGNSTYSSANLFVAGLAVMEYRKHSNANWEFADITDILDMLTDGETVDVRVAETADEAEKIRAAWRDYGCS